MNINPIMVKEFRSRMRGWRAFAILTVYLGFLGLFTYGIYRIALASPPYSTPLSPTIGQWMYAAIVYLSLFTVTILMPALTAPAISNENEKLTLEMLQATPMSPHAIVVGKLVASAGYIFLLIFATIPLLSLVFTFGGVAPIDLILSLLMILATAVFLGLVGLFFSAWRRRTIQAIVLSYVFIVLLLIGTFVVYIGWGLLAQEVPPRHILLFNPISALASVIAAEGVVNSNSPLVLFAVIAGWVEIVDGDIGLIRVLHPLWHYTLAFYLGLGGLVYWLTTRLLRPVQPWRLATRTKIILAAVVLVYLLGTGGLFLSDWWSVEQYYQDDVAAQNF